MTGMDEKALRAALEEANSPATVTRTTRATVEAAIRAYLSALPAAPMPGVTLGQLQRAHVERQEEWCPDQKPDLSFRGNEMAGEVGEACNVIKKLERERQGWRGSRATKEHLAEELGDVIHTAVLCAITAGIDIEPATIAKFNATSEKNGLSSRLSALDVPAHPEGVKAAGGAFMPEEPTANHLRALFQMNGAQPRTTDEAKAIYAALLNISRSSLSHPEPVAQEAVAWKEFDHTTIDYVLRYGGRCRECADHLGLCPNGLPCDVDDAKTAIRWVLKALNYGIANGFLPHPSPSPEQGEDEQPIGYMREKDNDGTAFWVTKTQNSYYGKPVYAANSISTLRARVAELEARATPQADPFEHCAKEAEAQAELVEQMRGVYPGDPTGALGRDANKMRNLAKAIRSLSNQGSSSNGQ